MRMTIGIASGSKSIQRHMRIAQQSAGQLASVLDRAPRDAHLVYMRDSLKHVIARSLQDPRERAHAFALELYMVSKRDLDLQREVEANSELDRHGDVGYPLPADWVHCTAGEVVEMFNPGEDLTEALSPAIHLAEVVGRINEGTDRFGHELRLARNLVGALEAAVQRPDVIKSREKKRKKQGSTSPLAGRLLVVAARMLPPRDRARYGDEFRSELWEIARARDGRWAQIAYAARQVRSSVQTRTALRAPRRRSAVP
jgi:hypothetical protein